MIVVDFNWTLAQLPPKREGVFFSLEGTLALYTTGSEARPGARPAALVLDISSL